eukprot:5136132-Amphidinium_carterae.1
MQKPLGVCAFTNNQFARRVPHQYKLQTSGDKQVGSCCCPSGYCQLGYRWLLPLKLPMRKDTLLDKDHCLTTRGRSTNGPTHKQFRLTELSLMSFILPCVDHEELMLGPMILITSGSNHYVQHGTRLTSLHEAILLELGCNFQQPLTTGNKKLIFDRTQQRCWWLPAYARTLQQCSNSKLLLPYTSFQTLVLTPRARETSGSWPVVLVARPVDVPQTH